MTAMYTTNGRTFATLHTGMCNASNRNIATSENGGCKKNQQFGSFQCLFQTQYPQNSEYDQYPRFVGQYLHFDFSNLIFVW